MSRRTVLLAVVALVALLPGCNSPRPATPEADLAAYEGLARALERGDDLLLFDVRTPEEYATGHIPGARNEPLATLGSSVPQTYRDRLIVVYCQTGRRSLAAVQTLTGRGFTRVVDFGGIGNWKGPLAAPQGR